ncbi:hypothetical protein D3C75_754320 [compost metagenome]
MRESGRNGVFGRVRVGDWRHLLQANEVYRILRGVRCILLQTDRASGLNGAVEHHIGFIIDMARRAGAGRIAGAGLRTVEPGIFGGQADGLGEHSIHIYVQCGIGSVTTGRIGNGKTGDKRVRAGFGGEFHIAAGRIQSDRSSA